MSFVTKYAHAAPNSDAGSTRTISVTMSTGEVLVAQFDPIENMVQGVLLSHLSQTVFSCTPEDLAMAAFGLDEDEDAVALVSSDDLA